MAASRSSLASRANLTDEPDRIEGGSVRGLLGRRTGVTQADALMNAAADAMADGKPGADDLYSDALERWLALGGADLEERTASVAAELGLDVDLDMAMTALSGGQAARAGLAALLLSRYDAFLLDEPTNDLDLEGLDHLEEFVQNLSAPTVVISHDRECLTRVVTKVAEIDPDALDLWYLGVYADAIEWVEITNTRGMSQFADGGIIATKPYISSGNYIDKMSNYCKQCHFNPKEKNGETACPFNALYWNFLVKKREVLANNQRMSMMYRILDKKSEEELSAHLERAEMLLTDLDSHLGE